MCPSKVDSSSHKGWCLVPFTQCWPIRKLVPFPGCCELAGRDGLCRERLVVSWVLCDQKHLLQQVWPFRLHSLVWNLSDFTACFETFQTSRFALKPFRLQNWVWNISDFTVWFQTLQTSHFGFKHFRLYSLVSNLLDFTVWLHTFKISQFSFKPFQTSQFDVKSFRLFTLWFQTFQASQFGLKTFQTSYFVSNLSDFTLWFQTFQTSHFGFRPFRLQYCNCV